MPPAPASSSRSACGISTYEPASRPPAGSEPNESERATYVYARNRTIQRETADGRQ